MSFEAVLDEEVGEEKAGFFVPISKDVEDIILDFIDDQKKRDGERAGDFERFKELLLLHEARDDSRMEELERRLVAHMNERDMRWANQFEAFDKRMRRTEEKHDRRLAEHGSRLGHVEVETASHTTQFEKLERDVSEKIERVERDSGEWKKEDLKEKREKLHWYERQTLIWIVAFLTLLAGTVAGYVLHK